MGMGGELRKFSIGLVNRGSAWLRRESAVRVVFVRRPKKWEAIRFWCSKTYYLQGRRPVE